MRCADGVTVRQTTASSVFAFRREQSRAGETRSGDGGVTVPSVLSSTATSTNTPTATTAYTHGTRDHCTVEMSRPTTHFTDLSAIVLAVVVTVRTARRWWWWWGEGMSR